MKNLVKLVVVLFFGSAGLFVFVNENIPAPGRAQAAGQATPTPPAVNANASVNAAANAPRVIANAANSAASTSPSAPPAGDKKIPKTFTLGKDSQSEHGEVTFDHETHASKMYSPDGKSAIGCVECHHTDQPKSALKPPLITSQREVALTLASWRTSTAKVNECRTCHFQTGNVPESGVMPTATYDEGGKKVTKELSNELAYHINCNTCHDAAAKLRPDLKSRPGFATSTDCKTCHRPN